MQRWTLALIGSLALVLGITPAVPATAAIGTPGTILVTTEYVDSGVYFKATAPDDLPAMVGEETLLVDFSTPGRVKFKMLSGAKLLEFGAPTGKFDSICQTPDGFLLYQPTSDLSCYGVAVLGGQLSRTHRTVLDFSAVSKATNIVVVDGPPEADAAYPAIEFIGGTGPDYVQGGALDDILDGGPGNDSLFGAGGRDELRGNEGDDDIDGEEGDDYVNGDAGNDYVVGGPDADIILGGTGIDTIDSEDNLADTRVDCQNEPGQGKVFFDLNLDIPYNCPVTLLPGQPRDVTGSGNTKEVTVDWAPPEFDGNAEIVSYKVSLYQAGISGVADYTIVDGNESSATFRNLDSFIYAATVEATNAEGTGPAGISATFTVRDGPAAPVNVQSSFVSFDNALLSWARPENTDVSRYEIALRVTNKKDRKWLKWETLPDKVGAGLISVNFGPDLKLVKNRRYQFRIRTISGKETSEWETAPVRYAAPLARPKVDKAQYTRDWVLNVTTTLGPAKVIKYNDISIDVVSGAVSGYASSRVLGTVARPSANKMVAGFSPLFGDEFHQECEFDVAYQAAGREGKTSFTSRCYI